MARRRAGPRRSGSRTDTSVRAPRLIAAANSSAVLVTGAGGVVRVFDVPSLAVRAEHAERDTHLAVLSAGGRALLVLTAGDELLVHAGAGWHVHPSPRGRREVLGVAVADDGGAAAPLTPDGLQRRALPPAGGPGGAPAPRPPA